MSMTEKEKELYIKTKERMRRLGKENPADVIIYLAAEINLYRAKIRGLEDSLERCQTMNRLLELDVKDWRKLAESKAEEIYPEFMRDYKAAMDELDGAYEDIEDLRKERDELQEELKERNKLRRLVKNIDEVHERTPEDEKRRAMHAAACMEVMPK